MQEAACIAHSSALESADAALIEDELGEHICVRPHHVGAFLYACAKAAYGLRMRSMDRIIDSIRKRKTSAARDGATFDHARNRELVAIFNRLRPLVPTPRDGGLFGSLVLLEFLAVYKSYPNWVWGITRRPFGTHLWVQQGGWVFNCPVEYVLRFTPILSV